MNGTSHVRLMARGMRKNYALHVDSGFQSKPYGGDPKDAYGTGWVLTSENSRFAWDGVGVKAHWGQHIGHSTIVELNGILNALKTIKEYHLGIIHPTNHITIYCDNDSVKMLMDQRINEGIVSDFGKDTVDEIMGFQNLVHFSFEWEKGHSDNIMNNLADTLSFVIRKDLEKFESIGAFHTEIIMMDILRRHELNDSRLEEHITGYERRKHMCKVNDTVELSYVVTRASDGSRKAEWFALTGEDFYVGLVDLPQKRDSMETAKIASAVMNSYRNSGSHIDQTVIFALPSKRELMDEVHLEIFADGSKKKGNKISKTVTLMKPEFGGMKVRFLSENNTFRGIAFEIHSS